MNYNNRYMKKLDLYLDTSVLCSFYDKRKPIRQLITQKWFEHEAKNYELYMSVVTVKEIQKFHEEKRNNVNSLADEYDLNILQLSEEAEKLANEYMKKGAIPKTEVEDAQHIAIATVNNILWLASWNFAHIVSVNPIRKIHEINKKGNYPTIEIATLEIYGGAKYGNLS